MVNSAHKKKVLSRPDTVRSEDTTMQTMFSSPTQSTLTPSKVSIRIIPLEMFYSSIYIMLKEKKFRELFKDNNW